MDLELFHPEVQRFAKRLLGEVVESPYHCGTSGVVMGYWVESHTLGCRREAGDPDLWAAHWAVWEELSTDGKSVLIGDPADGAFVSITPTKDSPGASMGAEMLIELGARRVKKTIPLETADQLAEIISNQLQPLSEAMVIVGSVRRRKPEVGDIEFVMLPKDLDETLKFLAVSNFTGGDRIQRGILNMERGRKFPIEIYIAHKPEEMGALLFMYTGDYQHNIAMRMIAKRRGWKLDQYGIWDAKTGKKLLQSPDERDFYDFLGVSWHDPEDRGFANRKKKKSSMGAIQLVELGTSKRRVGYIYLELLTPAEDGTDHWVLQVERVDPYGGVPKRFEVLFNDEGEAKYWFNNTNADEDLEVLATRASQ